MALSVISLLRSDSVAFGCEADMRTVDRSKQSDVNAEQARGISPRASHRSGLDTLASSGSWPRGAKNGRMRLVASLEHDECENGSASYSTSAGGHFGRRMCPNCRP